MYCTVFYCIFMYLCIPYWFSVFSIYFTFLSVFVYLFTYLLFSSVQAGEGTSRGTLYLSSQSPPPCWPPPPPSATPREEKRPSHTSPSHFEDTHESGPSHSKRRYRASPLRCVWRCGKPCFGVMCVTCVLGCVSHLCCFNKMHRDELGGLNCLFYCVLLSYPQTF